MIDWHSHILPGMDDGSRDVAESIALIDMQASQGASKVIATPHFYANDESIDSFLERRQEAYDQLQAALPKDAPEIVLGAEVRYYQGISRMEGLKSLRIKGSKLLLLEMPMATWTEYMVRELIEMATRSSTRIVLAHVDRYLHLQKKSVWDRLRECGILMQLNAGYVISFATKRKALALLKAGGVQFLGSDCHGLTSRPPKIGEAFSLVQKKLGDEFLYQMNEYGNSLLGSVNQ